MADDLMYYIWLRGILRIRVMSYILSAAKYSKSQAVKEFSLTEDAMSGFYGKPSLALKEFTELVQLRNSFRHSKPFLNLLLLAEISLAHRLGVKGSQPLVDVDPQVIFLFCVGNVRNRLSHFELMGNRGDEVPPLSVLLIGKLRMVLIGFAIFWSEKILSDQI